MSPGRTTWVIPEGWLPGTGRESKDRALVSHEAVCLLNAGDVDAHVQITVFFEDREPAGPYRLTVPARRTRHVRFDDLDDPERIPRETDFASVITSDVPVVAQHTRLDLRSEVRSLMTTVAWGG